MKRSRMLAATAALAAVAVASIALWSALAVPQEGFPGTAMITDHPALVEAYQSGKPTLILFTTITCPVCVMQERALEEVLPDYNGSVNYIHLMYTSGIEQIFIDWTIIKTPVSVFVGKDGTIYQRYDGQYLTADAVRQILERIK